MADAPGILFGLALALLAIGIYCVSEHGPKPLDPPPRPARSPSPEAEPPAPIVGIQTPYDEAEIAGLIAEIWELLVKLCYVTAESVAWPPPHRGHAINETLCASLAIDAGVVALMKRLPYPADLDDALRMHLWPFSQPYCYLDDGDIRDGRHPMGDENEVLLPHEIALTFNPRDGVAVVIDIKENTVRVIETMCPPPGSMSPEDAEMERPDEEFYYRNYYPQHAPTYLRRYIDSIKNLELIPARSGIGDGFYGAMDFRRVQLKMQKIITEEYGWPDNFRREDYRRDMEALWKRHVVDELDRLRHKYG